jgi:two-component sensor histidine kinase
MNVRARSIGLTDYQHHVKNLMAVIRSIAARTARNAASLEEFASHFDGRLAALGRAQRMLARTDAFVSDLEELVHEELLAQSVTRRVAVKGPAVLLPQKVTENLALAVHELVTNAIKFGALGCEGGRLSLTWKINGDKLLLEWCESGVTAMDTHPAHSGFGREWLEQGLAYQIGADTEMAFLPGGLTCMIALPLHLVAMEDAP